MVIEDDMEYLQVYVGATSMSMHDRFTLLAATSPFRGVGTRRGRGRRLSTNDGPLLNSETKNSRNQNIVDEVVQQLALDWRVVSLSNFYYFVEFFVTICERINQRGSLRLLFC